MDEIKASVLAELDQQFAGIREWLDKIVDLAGSCPQGDDYVLAFYTVELAKFSSKQLAPVLALAALRLAKAKREEIST